MRVMGTCLQSDAERHNAKRAERHLGCHISNLRRLRRHRYAALPQAPQRPPRETVLFTLYANSNLGKEGYSDSDPKFVSRPSGNIFLLREVRSWLIKAAGLSEANMNTPLYRKHLIIPFNLSSNITTHRRTWSVTHTTTG